MSTTMKTWDHEKLDCNIKNTSANNKSQLKPPHSFQNKAERNMREKNDDKNSLTNMPQL